MGAGKALHGDRRGHGLRGAVFSQQIPRFVSRSGRFDAAVLEAFGPINERFFTQLAQLDIAVDLIPRMRLAKDADLFPDEIVADGPVPLGRVIPAGVDNQGKPTRARIVLFRAPIEARCPSREALLNLLQVVLTALVATYLNVEPSFIDPDFDEKWQ